MNNAKPNKIVIAGAGSIGCYVGAHLINAKHNVTLLGRQNIANQIETNGLHITNFSGLDFLIPSPNVHIDIDPICLTAADIILVTVKSAATVRIAELIKKHAPKDTTVISLQNGINNTKILRQLLPSHNILAGMVPFNVVQMGNGHFHQGTTGTIIIEENEGDIANAISTPTLPIIDHSNIQGVQWGKLLINLNNALNALSGISLREQIGSQDWRKLLADQMAEALPLLKKQKTKAVSFTPLPPALAPHILRLPNSLYKYFANRMPRIDPKARSSMWEDLQQGRLTEIDELQGTVITLAKANNLSAPLNARVYNLIRKAEKDGLGSPKLSPEDVSFK